MCEPPRKHARTLQGNVTWRDGRFSDWTVRLGSVAYQLHAFSLARASTFFESHIEIVTRSSEDSAHQQQRETDITEIVPMICHSVFEDVLEFIYCDDKQDFTIGLPKLVQVLKVAEVLGIDTLIEHILESGICTYEWNNAPYLLENYVAVHVDGTEEGCAMQQFFDEAVARIAGRFAYFLELDEILEHLRKLPFAVIVRVVAHDNLRVAHENDVYDFVFDTWKNAMKADPSLRTKGPQPDRDALFREVRWNDIRAPLLEDIKSQLSDDMNSCELFFGSTWANFLSRFTSGVSHEAGACPLDSKDRDMFVQESRSLWRPKGFGPCGTHEFDFLCLCGDRFERSGYNAFDDEKFVNLIPEHCIGDFIFTCMVGSPSKDEDTRHLSVYIFCRPRRKPSAHWYFNQLEVSLETRSFMDSSYLPHIEFSDTVSFNSDNDVHVFDDYLLIDKMYNYTLGGLLHMRCSFDEADDFTVYAEADQAEEA